jgi:hypothetical protein
MIAFVNEQKNRGSNETHDLQFDPLSIQFNGPNFEVNTDGGNKRRSPCIVAET